jgi:hypothetical protein
VAAADGSGSIEPGELLGLLQALSPEAQACPDDASFVRGKCDVNGDGVISRDELLPMIGSWLALAQEKIADLQNEPRPESKLISTSVRLAHTLKHNLNTNGLPIPGRKLSLQQVALEMGAVAISQTPSTPLVVQRSPAAPVQDGVVNGVTVPVHSRCAAVTGAEATVAGETQVAKTSVCILL